MTIQEAKTLLGALNEVFYMARIVDPEKKEVWTIGENGDFHPSETCYFVWNKTDPCDNCMTINTCRERTNADKYEVLNGEVYHITAKPVDIDGRAFAFEIVTLLDNADDVVRREVLIHEREQNMEIIRILATEYSSVYYIDLKTDGLNPYTMNEQTESEFGQIFNGEITYSEAFRLYVNRLVYPEDRAMMLEAGSVENICRQLQRQKTFITQYRSADNRYCEMKFVKVDGENETPTAVALGFSDRDEEVRREKQIERNQEIIQTLSAEYASVYHVDLLTGDMTISKLSQDTMASVGSLLHQGINFSQALDTFLRQQVRNSDYEALRNFGSADYLKSLLRGQKVYTRTYRVGTEDNFRYNEMKIVKVNDDEEATAIVLGVADKDQEIRAALKAEIEKTRNTEIIEILASEYTSVYYIDLTTDELTPYTMNKETENQFGVLFKNMRYSDAFRMYVNTLIYSADRTMMLRAGSIGNIVRELRTKKTFITTYRSDNNGDPHYCEMKFVKVGTEEGIPTAVALGFADKDEELRLRIEQETVRRRNTEIIEILASEYTSVYYIDLTTDELDPYTMNAETESEFGQIFRSGIKYTDAFRMYVDTNVHPEDRARMLRAGSVYNIIEQLSGKKSFLTTFRSADKDEVHYCEMKFVKVGDDDNPQAVALGFSIADEAYRRELAEKQREAFINGLADDFEAVCHVNLDTETVEFVRISDEYRERNPLVENETNYYKVVNLVASNILTDDQEKFLQAMMPENLNTAFAENYAFFHNYRIVQNGQLSYYQMKLICTGDWNTEHSFLIGIHNMDEVTREQIRQEEILQEARMAAEAANRAKSSFLFNMSHDIRTPMNAIIGFNAMAKKHLGDPDKVVGYLDKVEVSSQHLLSIINDVLDMARIESGKVTIEENVAHVRESANNLTDIVAQSAKDRQLTLETDFADIRHDCVYADSLRVNRVLMNIISNAIKYTNPGGTVRYTIHELESRRPDYASFEFVVEDNGIGMSQEYLKHVFEAFTRESTSTVSGVQGTGLGMAITKELVDLMKGDIRIDSEQGKGTCVTINMDFRIAEDEGIAQTDVRNADTSVLKGKRVLLVEDNELNREIAKEILEEFGMQVDEAADGSIAVEICKEMVKGKPEEYYDAILMDVQMPLMDGYEATRLIRQLPSKKKSQIPIIAMTANAFAEDKKRAFDAGMDAHVAKPINVEELTSRLLSFLDR